MKNVCYWCPFISKVATVRSVIKSAESLKKYSNGKFRPIILNVAGEWNEFRENENNLNIKIVNITNLQILDKRNSTGFFKSRFIYFFIFIACFFPTLYFLKKQKPDFLLVHLISSLPLFLNIFFKFQSKIILRISGLPKLQIHRKIFWKIALKKIFLVTSPTIGTYDELNRNLPIKNKIEILYDPIISPQEIKKKSIEKINNIEFSEFYLAIGRLTKQKNFLFLIDSIKDLIKENNLIKLIIIGDGELKNEINKKISHLGLQNNIKLICYKENIYNYLSRSKGFILSSLWEDPGFVLVEAAYLNVPILSSDCKNGPSEILNYGKNGILFKSNNKESFKENFKRFFYLQEDQKRINIIKTKKYVKNFTVFSHYTKLRSILLNYGR